MGLLDELSRTDKSVHIFYASVAVLVVIIVITIAVLAGYISVYKAKENLYTGGFYTSGASDRFNSELTSTNQVSGGAGFTPASVPNPGLKYGPVM